MLHSHIIPHHSPLKPIIDAAQRAERHHPNVDFVYIVIFLWIENSLSTVGQGIPRRLVTAARHIVRPTFPLHFYPFLAFACLYPILYLFCTYRR